MRREKGQRGKGDERSQGDPMEGGCEDEWLKLSSKDVIVFDGMGTDGHSEEANLFNQKMLDC